MLRLIKSLSAWGTPSFNETLRNEVTQLDANQLPLQKGLSMGSYAVADNLNVTILSSSQDFNAIHVRMGIFYSSIIAGCSCADDPTPVDENNEYCEVELIIDNTTALTSVTLLSG